MEQIEEDEIQMNGISYTSILVYLNETLNQTDITKMSHKAGPATAIVDFIHEQMSDEWRDFPRIIMKAITANTYFFTRMMEMCQYKQIRPENLNLQVLSQIVYQVVKIGILRK
jgi:hypothetical protein